MKSLNEIIKDFFILGTSASLLSGCSSAYEPPETKISQIKNPVEFSKRVKHFSDIQWILDKEDNVILWGEQPVEGEVTRLEDAVYNNLDVTHELRTQGLNEWLNPTLARLVPLKSMIEKHSSHYDINPLWAAIFFSFESQLTPSDFNRYSDDFGLGQVKRQSEALAKTIGKMENSEFYSPHLDVNKSIYDPETNIIMSLMLHRYNIARYGLKNSDQAYAVYVRGIAGLDDKGQLNNLTIDLLNGFHSRYDIMEKVVPMFTLNDKEINDLDNEDTKRILQIHNSDTLPVEKYWMMLDYFTDSLVNKRDGSARSVLVFNDCVAFATTLDKSYGIDQSVTYDVLEILGDKIMDKVDNRDLKSRMNRALGILKYARD